MTPEDESIIDLNSEYGKRTLAERIKYEINKYVESQHTELFRSHLGASVIGNQCSRYLWYHFHWFRASKPDGRSLRLFGRGHREEPIIRNLLKAVGCIFVDTVDIDGKQISVSALNGHFGGSCDGIATAPHLGLTTPALVEVKTSGTGAKFNDLAKKQVRSAQYRHFVQQCVYGKLLGIKFCVYIAVNKNDDDIYVEILELDETVANETIQKAEFVILTRQPPQRISEKPEYYLCNMCEMKPVCHQGAVPAHNCRTCVNAFPVENGRWHCRHWNALIPKEELIKGCPSHQTLPQ